MSTKKVNGVGINDLKGVGYTDEMRAIYNIWRGMLSRCYAESYHKWFTSYNDCTVCTEWLLFSNFYRWAKENNWKNNALDKDLRVKGNRVYSPDTCIFISKKLNSFLITKENKDSELPVGTYYDKYSGKYKAHISDILLNKRVTIGYYDSVEEAHTSWVSYKRTLALKLAELEEDETVADLLRVFANELR